MARQEQDREDLLREATALVERAELQIPAEPEHVVVGFRRSGAVSVYFGASPVYQFNEQNELRRAYLGGDLIKAEQGHLVRIQRVRDALTTTLLAQPFSAAEEAAFLTAAQCRLSQLQLALSLEDYRLIGQVPAEANIIGRIRTWLASLPAALKIAAVPNA